MPNKRTNEEVTLNASEMARTIVNAIEERKGEDIMMLDLAEVSSIADYFVVATADNERLLGALVRYLNREILEKYQLSAREEGSPESGWVLLDYNWVVVHLFSPEQRQHYRLEHLWSEAQTILRIQ